MPGCICFKIPWLVNIHQLYIFFSKNVIMSVTVVCQEILCGRLNKLTPWRQNPKVHHRIHNSPPTILILNLVNPHHTLPTNLPKVHFDPILLSTPWSFKGSFYVEDKFSNMRTVHMQKHSLKRDFHCTWYLIKTAYLRYLPDLRTRKMKENVLVPATAQNKQL
jgi:hypothetical protein